MLYASMHRCAVLCVLSAACGPVVERATNEGSTSTSGASGSSGSGVGSSSVSGQSTSTSTSPTTTTTSESSSGDEGSTSTGQGGLACSFDGVSKPTGVLSADGTIIELIPSGLRFAVPELVLGAPASTILLNEDELAMARDGLGEWTTEYTAVANMLLPFDRCGAHFGNGTWPSPSSWFTLWSRAYVFEQSIADLEASFIDNAASVATAAGGTDPQVSQKIGGPWRKTQVQFDLFFMDYGGPAAVDMRLRDYGGVTIGFVFMYPVSLGGVPDPEGSIDEVLDSVCVPDGAGGCCSGD